MAWLFWGQNKELRIGANQKGSMRIWGNAEGNNGVYHEEDGSRSDHPEIQFMKDLRARAHASWSISPSDEQPDQYSEDQSRALVGIHDLDPEFAFKLVKVVRCRWTMINSEYFRRFRGLCLAIACHCLFPPVVFRFFAI